MTIESVLARYGTKLNESGAGPCPFHKASANTLQVADGRYECHECFASGDSETLVMQLEGLAYQDAAKFIEEMEAQDSLPDPYQSVRQTMNRVAALYQAQRSEPAAIQYLRDRKLTQGVADHFKIGYALPGWRALSATIQNYDTNNDLIAAGLQIVSDKDRRYDRFRDRIMFPIFDVRNRIIGFGGRVLGDDLPKYLNSPESAFFNKGRELYGLAQALPFIEAEGYAVVVEGYMDVIALAQHGIRNVVATLGTACSAANIQRLLRFAPRIVFCLDGDEAGVLAANRAATIGLTMARHGDQIAIAHIPDELDPDELVRKDKDAMLRVIQSAKPHTAVIIEEWRALNKDEVQRRVRQLPYGQCRKTIAYRMAVELGVPVSEIDPNITTKGR